MDFYFKCPFCKSNELYETFFGLAVHVRKRHRTKCPVCDYDGKSIITHARQQGDLKHKILFGLFNHSHNKNKNKKYIRECRDLAYRYCLVIMLKPEELFGRN